MATIGNTNEVSDVYITLANNQSDGCGYRYNVAVCKIKTGGRSIQANNIWAYSYNKLAYRRFFIWNADGSLVVSTYTGNDNSETWYWDYATAQNKTLSANTTYYIGVGGHVGYYKRVGYTLGASGSGGYIYQVTCDDDYNLDVPNLINTTFRACVYIDYDYPGPNQIQEIEKLSIYQVDELGKLPAEQIEEYRKLS